ASVPELAARTTIKTMSTRNMTCLKSMKTKFTTAPMNSKRYIKNAAPDRDMSAAEEPMRLENHASALSQCAWSNKQNDVSSPAFNSNGMAVIYTPPARIILNSWPPILTAELLGSWVIASLPTAMRKPMTPKTQ